MRTIPTTKTNPCRPNHSARAAAAVAILSSALTIGCATAEPADHHRTVVASSSGAPQSASNIIALADGQAITWDTARPLLSEAAGGDIIAEIVLHRALRRECQDRSITIGDTEIERERRLLLAQLHEDGDTAAQLLEEVRARRRLGPRRYARLLERNAALRALVADDVPVTATALGQAYDLRYGDRYEIRLIVTASLQDMATAQERIEAGTPFGEVAAALSTDLSAQRGGVLDPISAADPAYPAAIRDAMTTLRVGEVSRPLGLEHGYAIIRLESVVQGEKPPMEEVEASLTDSVRLHQERLRMNELARSLVATADVSVLEPGINWPPGR
ncbi:MAG: peptidyl-prolyl cis-trans isomerase [Phycisphaerales bacterium]|nr:peptidyl-prolyl cis-trans isomerase [Phycisphaerales bacterium]